MLKNLIKKWLFNQIDESVLFDLQGYVTRQELFTLVECLWDTYVDNKNLAMKLLFLIDKEIFSKYVWYLDKISFWSVFYITFDLIAIFQEELLWNSGEIVIQSKADRFDVFCLSDDVFTRERRAWWPLRSESYNLNLFSTHSF
jgi:hypothetical protein